jgi:hypothetical protein
MERARKKVFVVSAKRRNREAAQFHLNGKGIDAFFIQSILLVSDIFGRYRYPVIKIGFGAITYVKNCVSVKVLQIVCFSGTKIPVVFVLPAALKLRADKCYSTFTSWPCRRLCETCSGLACP